MGTAPTSGGRGRTRRRAVLLLAAGAALAASLISPPAARAGAAGGTPRAWVQAGWDAYRAGTLDAAERAFRAAAAGAPAWATPAVWLGAVLAARGQRAQAAAWFRAALARHPTPAEAGYAQAWLARLGLAVERQRWPIGGLEGLAAFVHAANPGLTPAQARWVSAALRAAAASERIDVRLLAAVVYVESRFEHQSVSRAGAEGLGQLMPDTAAGLGVNPRDPWQNLVGAARLLREDYEEFHSVPLALAAYNAGSAAVRRWAGIPPYAETQWYVWAVLWVEDGLTTSG
jgi:soluble lytic murein transglycosylase-like protein